MCEREKNKRITSIKGSLSHYVLVFAEACIFGGLFVSEEMI